MTLSTITSRLFKGQPALSGGRRPGDAISRGVCLHYTWSGHFVNKTKPFAQKMARLTAELEGQFEESDKSQKSIRSGLGNLKYE